MVGGEAAGEQGRLGSPAPLVCDLAARSGPCPPPRLCAPVQEPEFFARPAPVVRRRPGAVTTSRLRAETCAGDPLHGVLLRDGICDGGVVHALARAVRACRRGENERYRATYPAHAPPPA